MTVIQLAKKLQWFYITGKLIAAITTACRSSYPGPDESGPQRSHIISYNTSYLRLDLQNDISSSIGSTKQWGVQNGLSVFRNTLLTRLQKHECFDAICTPVCNVPKAEHASR